MELSDLDFSKTYSYAERGEFDAATDNKGNVYIADGQVYVYDSAGKQIKEIKVPERPTSLVFGGKDGKVLFVTGRGGLYAVGE
jgi:sugar lactone lactonase YvrE